MCKNLNYYCIKKFGVEIIYTQKFKFIYKEHSHITAYIIGIIIDGSIDFKSENKEYKLCKGQTFLIKPYEAHAIRTEFRYSLLSIVLPIEFLANNNFKNTKNAIISCLNKLDDIIVLTFADINKIINLIKMVYEDKFNRDFDKSIELVLNWCINYPEKNFSLDKLAEITNFDKYYYLRMFKQQIGLTPHKFQIQNRIRKAQKLLEKNISITEVALITGFYDQSHFIKQFKNIVGISPTGYKKSLLK